MAYDTSKLASLQALKDTATRIKKEYLAAISKAGHASFQKAEAIPTPEEAQENILYLVKNTETSHYDIYATSVRWWQPSRSSSVLLRCPSSWIRTTRWLS